MNKKEKYVFMVPFSILAVVCLIAACLCVSEPPITEIQIQGNYNYDGNELIYNNTVYDDVDSIKQENNITTFKYGVDESEKMFIISLFLSVYVILIIVVGSIYKFG